MRCHRTIVEIVDKLRFKIVYSAFLLLERQKRLGASLLCRGFFIAYRYFAIRGKRC